MEEGGTYKYLESENLWFHVIRCFLGCLGVFGDIMYPVANVFEDVVGLA
jgi:hypothetical protein